MNLLNEYDFSRAEVVCDESNNPPSLRVEGKLCIDIFVPKHESHEDVKIFTWIGPYE